jgi:poly(beta-D-mannuronate) lyase
MRRILLLQILLCAGFTALSNTILVKNEAELTKISKDARPGDIILLQNGYWKDVKLSLNCNGTKEAPIVFKAQTAGKVMITGNSSLKIGGTYLSVEGLYFTDGFSGSDAVISFKSGKDRIANHCRVTNTVIDDFNNPRRLNENYWVAFYGRNNRLDHCSFYNKKNIGVLLAVILDDERSRESFHLIDHNYFGLRLPLASNGGEIIRVGVSEHCQFNSNTQIADNFFEYCDGETEIVSIKSCGNIVRNNLFKECQGAVALRHGNFNTVEGNVFLGNNKAGTGGVRIINKGQWVVNNFFYQCTGRDFRSPLSIMNGIPNSPANRYLEVSDAVVGNNSFYDCSPVSFCVGSDSERTIQPVNVKFLNNMFYHTAESRLYNVYDDIKGISFSGNLANQSNTTQLFNGFVTTTLNKRKAGSFSWPLAANVVLYPVSDSLQTIAKLRLVNPLSEKPGCNSMEGVKKVITNAQIDCGTNWFKRSSKARPVAAKTIRCKTAAAVIGALAAHTSRPLIIRLTEKEYRFSMPLNINSNVTIRGITGSVVKWSMEAADQPFFIQIKAGNSLSLQHLSLDLSAVSVKTFISTDTSGSSNHSNFSINDCSIVNCRSVFFNAARSGVADSIVVSNCSFSNGGDHLFRFAEETGKKGYYNAEQLKIVNNSFTDHKGSLLSIWRTGNDESTMGPALIFSNNTLSNCSSGNKEALIHLYGVQRSSVYKNQFSNCNKGGVLVLYEDLVKAVHILRDNRLINSGVMVTNKFVE